MVIVGYAVLTGGWPSHPPFEGSSSERPAARSRRPAPGHQGRRPAGRHERHRAPGLHHGAGGGPARGAGRAAVAAPSTASPAPAAPTPCCIPLRALGLKPGDEVIAPAFTFFATAGRHPQRRRHVRSSWTSSPAPSTSIRPRSRPPSRRGPGPSCWCTSSGRWRTSERSPRSPKKHGLMLIEDAAQAIGARRKVDGQWRAAGELGTVGSFSFFPTKNLGAWGDGGMMVAQDDTLADRLRRERLHGGAREYYHDEVGLNSRLDSIQAAVLLAKLPYLAAWGARRRDIAALYTAALRRRRGRDPAAGRPGQRAHLPPVHHPRRAARRAAGAPQVPRASGTRCTTRWRCTCSPASRTSATGPGALPITERATAEVVSLPIYPELTSAQTDAVIAAVREFLPGMTMTTAQASDREGRAPRGALRRRRARLRRAAARRSNWPAPGYKVLGFDILPKVVDGLNAGRSHVKDISDAALQEVAGERAVRGDHRPRPARRARRDLDLRADAALEVQGPRRQLHRRPPPSRSAGPSGRARRSSSRAPPIPARRGS